MVCDLVLLYLDAKADLYWKEKFEEVRIGPHRREEVLKLIILDLIIFCPLVKTQFPRSGKNLVEQL